MSGRYATSGVTSPENPAMQQLVDAVESCVISATQPSLVAGLIENAIAQLEEALLKVRVAGHALFTGPQAREAYEAVLGSIREDGPPGKAYVALKYCGELELHVREEHQLEDLRLENIRADVEFVLIDSSTRQGDVWKATFYPRQEVTTFVKGT